MAIQPRLASALLAALVAAAIAGPAAAGEKRAVQPYTWDFEAGEMRPSSPQGAREEAPAAKPEPRREHSQERPRPVFRGDGERADHARDERRERVREDRRERRERVREEREERREHISERRDRDRRHRGASVAALPSGHRHYRHRHDDYFFASGLWYQPWGTSYVRVGPPYGLVVTALPVGYTTVWVGSTPYYHYVDTWYRPYESGGYVIVEDPPERRYAAQDDPPAEIASDTLFVYPGAGQSAGKQAEDRFECHAWASGQTGYDPSNLSPAGSSRDMLAKRPDYLRAMTACLEGRGYTVR